jgi:hypothetical protein
MPENFPTVRPLTTTVGASDDTASDDIAGDATPHPPE